MLSCSCDWEAEAGSIMYWFEDVSDFEPLKTTRRKRCCSCKELININALCIRYPRYRYPHSDIEARITGCDPDFNEEPSIRIADHFHCEKCGEIFLNLSDIGYDCLFPNEKMSDMLKQYHEISGFEQKQTTDK